MTDQELKDLVASNAVAIAELRESLRESRKESDRQTDELRAAQRETDRQIKQTNEKLGRQIGALGNKFGSFAEGMALPSMRKMMMDEFGMDSFAPRQTKRVNGRSLELDGFAYGDREKPVAFVIEVKSHLKQEDIDQVLKTIEELPKFYQDHAHRTIYGLIVAVDIADAARNRALKEGLYLARLSDDAFRLQVPRNFKPKAFGPFKNGKKNGRPARGKRRKK